MPADLLVLGRVPGARCSGRRLLIGDDHGDRPNRMNVARLLPGSERLLLRKRDLFVPLKLRPLPHRLERGARERNTPPFAVLSVVQVNHPAV